MQIYGHEKLLRVQKAVSAGFGIRCDHPQVPRPVAAIVDLSDRVFSAGMAYVALSRVRSLSGLHLIEFHSKSLMVSPSCLKEVNRLREKYRPDLPLYALPAPTKKATKRKLSGSNLCGDQPRPKKQRTATKTVARKRKQTFDKSSEPPKKKAPSSNTGALHRMKS